MEVTEMATSELIGSSARALAVLNVTRSQERPMSTSELIGSSPKLAAILEDVKAVAATNCAVLIQGETGTGKELVARLIHDASGRRQHRCVVINCAALPAALVESELFGYERGAFTGAVSPNLGRLQAADAGTLFLDEIGDLPIELQPKLLRAIQEQAFERLGSSHTIRVDMRVIAATNQDLGHLVEARRFRMDLYYRLNVFPITLPPLRERTDDIPLLAHHFVRTYAYRHRKSIAHIPKDVMAAFIGYHWPGNIRELQNFIERSVVLTKGAELQAPVAELVNKPGMIPGARTLADAERAHIISVLRETNWMVGGRDGAAARLGLVRTTLIAKMRKLEISRETADQRGPYHESANQLLRGARVHDEREHAAEIRTLSADWF